MAKESRCWVLARRPAGEPTPDCFELEERPLPELQEGQIRVDVHWLSLDPYMRARMRDEASYATPLALGDVIVGESAGVVAASRSPRWKEGDTLCAHQGWRTGFVVSGDDPTLLPADTGLAPLSAWLGVVGMPGRTAYFGLQRVGKPEAGETLVVSAASGAVGSAVGQIGKIRGLRVVGIAGGERKCRYCTDALGFDACIDYKGGRLEADLAEACPDGIDIYFENVGGVVSRAVAPLLNPGSRVPICGFISLYNESGDLAQAETPLHLFGRLDPKPEHRFFTVREWLPEWLDASRQLATWLREGRLAHRESIAEGFESAPAAFAGLFRGENFGKQLVRVAPAA